MLFAFLHNHIRIVTLLLDQRCPDIEDYDMMSLLTLPGYPHTTAKMCYYLITRYNALFTNTDLLQADDIILFVKSYNLIPEEDRSDFLDKIIVECIYHDKSKLIKYLLINKYITLNMTHMRNAIVGHSLKVVKVLIQQGVSFNQKDMLRKAFMRDRSGEMIELLLRKCTFTKDILNECYLNAIALHSPKVIKIFLQYGADINHVDVLNNALKGEFVNTVQFLISEGLKIDNTQYEIIFKVIDQNKLDWLKYIIESNIITTTSEIQYLMLYATVKNKNQEMIDYIMSKYRFEQIQIDWMMKV
jgi:hypothetical protein